MTINIHNPCHVQMPLLQEKEFSSIATAILVFPDGNVLWGQGIGAKTSNIGELCFNTAMTGYQEILTDLSYAGQIICFTNVHIGNVGTNSDDMESEFPAIMGCVLRNCPTEPSNYRSNQSLEKWLIKYNIPGIYQIDTRSLTHQLRQKGSVPAMLIHDPKRQWDVANAVEKVRSWGNLKEHELASSVSTTNCYQWKKGVWKPQLFSVNTNNCKYINKATNRRVCVIDFGVKRNILRLLVEKNCTVIVVPANTTLKGVLDTKPNGVLLSNGPGDPKATGRYVIPTIQGLITKQIPIFGICLGHQILALAIGGNTSKMLTGHHGANHPIYNHYNKKTEITSQNHGFNIVADSLPTNIISHTSLFDGTIAGISDYKNKFFSVQYHPESSPGPMDSHYLFDRFVEML